MPRLSTPTDLTQNSKPELDRADVLRSIAQLHKISTPEGVQRLEKVRIGGVDQWISIRGLHRDNPVLLFIHGGPGSPVMPTSWAFQKPWEDFFTVVQWDQRGVGKNWTHSDKSSLAPTITLKQLVDDAEELVAVLRETLHKDKLVVMGWSYGTSIGLELVKRRPQWISAYVGVGQIAIGLDSERYIFETILDIAKRRGDHRALAELHATEPYPSPVPQGALEKIFKVRDWVQAFNGGWYGLPDMSLFLHLQNLSTEYSAEEASSLEESTYWFLEQLAQSEGTALLDRPADSRQILDAPVILMMGRYDLQTPYVMAKRFFERIQAPVKRFITFERAAHFPMFEQPGRFLKSLIDEVLPLTEGAASFDELPDAPS